MASNQEKREITKEGRQVHVEKERVPKITSHFESLTVSPASNVAVSGGDRKMSEHGEERQTGRTVGKFEMQGGQEGRDSTKSSTQEGSGNAQDMSKYRQAAQQNSMDTIKAAEERYNQAKNAEAQKMGETKDTLPGAGDTAAEYTLQAKDYIGNKAATAQEVAAQKAAAARDVAAQKAAAARDVAAQKAAAARDVVAEKAAVARDVAADKTATARDVVAEKAAAAKDVTAQKAMTAKDVVAEKAVAAKDVIAEKATVAKDMTVETGKGTAGYVGKVAADVKDKALVAGWGAAEFTAEKVVGATKAVASVTAGAAGYAGEKAVAAKDVVAGAGVSAKDYTAQKLAAAKDAVVATEESAKEFAARKRAEKERELQARKLAESKGEVWTGGETTEEHSDIAGAGGQVYESAKNTISKPVQKAGEVIRGQPEEYTKEGKRSSGEAGGVLHAIGETIVEIGQTTKDLLVGEGKGGSTGRKE